MPNTRPKVGGYSRENLFPRIAVRDDSPSVPRARKVGRWNNQKTILSDVQVLELRRRYEFEGWCQARLLKEYGPLGIDKQYLYRLLDYQTRSKLIPRRP